MTLPISVIVPCWGRYCADLPAALASASEAAECVVVGDGAALAIAERAGDVVTVELATSRVGPAREQGLDAATQPFVLFLDADDVLLPGALPALLAAAIDQPGGAPAAAVGAFQRTSGGQWPRPLLLRIACSRWGTAALLFQNCLPAVGAAVVRRSALGRRPLFPDLEDEDWHAAVGIRLSGSVVHVRGTHLRYSVSPGSLSRRSRDLRSVWFSHDLLIQTAEQTVGRILPAMRLVDCLARPLRRRAAQRLVHAWGQAIDTTPRGRGPMFRE